MSAGAAVGRRVAGATLLDFAVSPLFVWDTFTGTLARDLHVSETTLSGVFSVALASFTVGVLVGGRVADTVAPRWLALLCGLGVVGGLVVTGLTSSLPVLIIGFGIVLGGTSGMGYATAVREAGVAAAGRGWAVGVVVSAYAAGAVALAPISAFLLATVGRPAAFAGLAAGLGALLAAAAALLPGSSASTQARTSTAKGGALRPTQGPVPALWLMFMVGSAPALVAFAHAGALTEAPGASVAAVSLLNAGNFAGRLIAGPGVDRVGLSRALHGTAASLVVATVALALSQHVLIALAALLVIGTQYGALSALTPVATARSVPADRFGSVFGVVFSGWGVAGLGSPVAA
ncbi:MAG TPA: MFS transporter, partial [Jiangellaceae bacterium]|nr:MFS transporter [Jiangellaceae bacterium]